MLLLCSYIVVIVIVDIVVKQHILMLTDFGSISTVLKLSRAVVVVAVVVV